MGQVQGKGCKIQGRKEPAVPPRSELLFSNTPPEREEHPSHQRPLCVGGVGEKMRPHMALIRAAVQV